MRDDVVDVEDRVGWVVAGWALCDPSELDPEASDALGVAVWTDGDGRRVPASTIRPWAGAPNCGWQHVTFVQLGRGPDPRQFVRDVDGDLRDSLRAALASGADRLHISSARTTPSTSSGGPPRTDRSTASDRHDFAAMKA